MAIPRGMTLSDYRAKLQPTKTPRRSAASSLHFDYTSAVSEAPGSASNSVASSSPRRGSTTLIVLPPTPPVPQGPPPNRLTRESAVYATQKFYHALPLPSTPYDGGGGGRPPPPAVKTPLARASYLTPPPAPEASAPPLINARNFTVSHQAGPIVPTAAARTQASRGQKRRKRLHRTGMAWRNAQNPSMFTQGDLAGFFTSVNNQEPPAISSDWRRLAFGVFMHKPGKNDEAEVWGPAVRSRFMGPVMDYDWAVAEQQQQLAKAVVARIGDLRQELSSLAPDHTDRPALEEERKTLMSYARQQSLWSTLVKVRHRLMAPLPGLWIRPAEALVVRQRTKRQTRNEIKKFEKEHGKKINDKEEFRKRRLRNYHQRILNHRDNFLRYHKKRQQDTRGVAAAIRKYWEGRDKKLEKERDTEERMRMLALKNNNMDEYIRLVEKTRNDRLAYLIQQTDAYIEKIGQMVRQQREEAGIHDETGFGGQSGDAMHLESGLSSRARRYYESTHRRNEEVVQPQMLRGGELKEYQLAGLQWMVSLYNNNLNGILADEMGLGKTIQSISLITYVMEVKRNLGPFLIVVPLSTMSNWVNEFKKWAPDVILVLYKGTPEARKNIFRDEMESGQYNVLLTTYDFIMKDKGILRKVEWEYIIVDEGHRMKNAESKFATTLGNVYSSKRRILLTGTPLQNNLPELWALLNFLLPTIFDSPDTFDQWFNKPFASFAGQESVALKDEEKLLIINRLHELLRPFMLRRVKSAVMGQLPTKVEKVLKCELSGYQRMLYKDITNKCLRSNGITTSMNNILMHLRKCCNHPFLFQDSYSIDYSIVSSSGKVELLDRILPKLKAAGHRILLFSQMTQAMDILDDYFRFRGYRFLRLDGSTSADDREQRMYQFNAPDSPYFIFSLSTRAGGLGLNLATADTVIFFDSDWNPSMDSQAMDRAHRIGQKNDVKVFRLITNTSVEEKIISRASEKSKLTNMVVEAGKFNRDSKEGERRAMLESLLLRDANEQQEEGTEESTVPDDDQLNDMMASTAEELELYRRMDVEREQAEQLEWDNYMRSQGKDPLKNKKPPRLSQELPKGAVASSGLVTGGADGGVAGAAAAAASGGGGGGAAAAAEGAAAKKRRRKETVAYSDKLTEKQFLRLMERRAEEEEREKEASKREKKPKLPQEVYEDMAKIQNAIRAMKTEDGRQLSALFNDKPPKKQFPDYYRIIKNPIDLKTIRQQIKNQEYRDLESFAAAFRLLFTNAQTYNVEESLVYQDAKQMSELFEAKYAELVEQWGSYVTSAGAAAAEAAVPGVKRKPGRPSKGGGMGHLSGDDASTTFMPVLKRPKLGDVMGGMMGMGGGYTPFSVDGPGY